MKNIAHMVDKVCKEVGTRRLPPGAKRGGKKEDSSKPSTCSIFKSLFGYPSNRASKYCDMSTTKAKKSQFA